MSAPVLRYLRTPGRLLVCLSWLLMLIAVIMPPIPIQVDNYRYLFMIDVTRSMNVTDYRNSSGELVSRLEYIKTSLKQVLRELPCGSEAGLGIFTERMPAILVTPVELCENFPVLVQTIQNIDWRMAWVADSNISQALYNTLNLQQNANLAGATLVFMTDGQEAPPVNPRYAPDYAEVQSSVQGASEDENDKPEELQEIRGVLVGTGDKQPSRIPKFNEEGEQTGYYTAEDVPHASRFGLPEDPSKIEGYVPRNAPWGNSKATGTEHLSAVRDEYLSELSSKAGLDYHLLTGPADLQQALTRDEYALQRTRETHLGYIPAALSLLLLCGVYLRDILQR